MNIPKYICFDCETTGLDDLCNLLTVCFIILDKNLNEIDKLNISLKQKNGYLIYPEALAINKIDLIKHHNSSTDIETSHKNLINFLNLNKTLYNLIPIGHNVRYDIKFIKNSGLLNEVEYNKYISFNSIDTITIAQFLKLSGKLPEKQSISLTSLCTYLNLNTNFDKTLEHSAEYDTKMTIKLLEKFKNIIGEPEINDNNNNKKRKHF